jgi:hypothetical protein
MEPGLKAVSVDFILTIWATGAASESHHRPLIARRTNGRVRLIPAIALFDFLAR